MAKSVRKPRKTRATPAPSPLAAHEAGHAVMIWLFGDGHHIDSISMVPDDQFDGRVCRSGFSGRAMVMAADFAGHPNVELLRLMALRELLVSMAGPAAEHRVSDEQYPDGWLVALFD